MERSAKGAVADGVRDSTAGHVLLEFKYTESVNETALAQAVAYDHFYRQAQIARRAGVDRRVERQDAAEGSAGGVGV